MIALGRLAMRWIVARESAAPAQYHRWTTGLCGARALCALKKSSFFVDFALAFQCFFPYAYSIVHKFIFFFLQPMMERKTRRSHRKVKVTVDPRISTSDRTTIVHHPMASEGKSRQATVGRWWLLSEHILLLSELRELWRTKRALNRFRTYSIWPAPQSIFIQSMNFMRSWNRRIARQRAAVKRAITWLLDGCICLAVFWVWADDVAVFFHFAHFNKTKCDLNVFSMRFDFIASSLVHSLSLSLSCVCLCQTKQSTSSGRIH